MSKGAKYVTSGSNIASLISAVQEQNKMVGDELDVMISQNFILTNISNNIADMTEGILAVKDTLLGEHMKALEQAREDRAFQEKLLEALKNRDKPAEKEKSKSDFSWLGLAGSLISGLIAGGIAFVATYTAEYIALWKKMLGKFKIFDKFEDLAKFFGEKWTAIKKVITTGVTEMMASVAEMWTGVKAFFKENSIVQKVVGFFDEVGKAVKSFFKVDEIIPELKIIGQSLKEIFAGPAEAIANLVKGPLEWIGKLFGSGGGSILESFMKMFTMFEPIVKLFKSLGTILGKLAVPLQIIMSVFDTVTGALDGWNKTQGGFMDKLQGAIKGGLTGLLNGLVGGLLDLLKDGLSWILDFFGMKDAAAWLDSFSFSKYIEDGIGMLVDGFANIITGIGEMFGKVSEFFSSIDWGGMLKSGMSWMVVALTAGASSMIEGLTGWSLTKKALDLAGLPDPRGGGDSAPAKGASSQGLSAASSDNTQAKTEQAAAAASTASTAASSSSSKQNVVNNAGPTAVISSKTTNWDPEDMMARGLVM